MSIRNFMLIPGLVLTECLLNVISEIILFTTGTDTCSVILSIPELISTQIWWAEMEELYHLD